jgi:regulator of nucleoside diphosphate kinase
MAVRKAAVVSNRIVVSAGDYDRLERLVARELRSREQRAAARRLAARLDRADILDDAQVPASVVTMNARLWLRDEPQREDRPVRLVYPGDDVGGPERTSVLSALGIALIGASEGETIRVDEGHGAARELTIVGVRAAAAPDRAPSAVVASGADASHQRPAAATAAEASR